jgi:glycosyltransferase involved in cell wall biosynthesis
VASRSRVIYIAHTGIEYSETFLSQTLQSFSERFDVCFLSGAKTRKSPDVCPTYLLGFDHLNLIERVYLRLVKCFSSGVTAEWEVRSRKAIRRVRPFLRKGDFVFIEYGVSAVLLRPLIEKMGLKVHFTLHGYDASALLNHDFYRTELKRVFELCEYCFVPSHHVRRRLAVDLGVYDKFVVLPCNPDPSVGESKQAAVKNKIVALGRLSEKKSPFALIEAMRLIVSEVPDARLYLIGDGPLYGEIRKRIVDLGLELSVELMGALPHELALIHLKEAHIFLHHAVTSLNGDQEGLPVAIMEALMLKKPIISTIHSGIPEVLVHGENGWLVQEHDFEGMARFAVELLLGNLSLSSSTYEPLSRVQVISDLVDAACNGLRDDIFLGGKR